MLQGKRRGVSAMATIRATCPDCGDVEFTSRDVQVRLDSEDSGSGTYAFACPVCTVTVVKAAESRTIDLLLASGVALLPSDIPAEVRERPDGDPLTHDDLLDFHQLLHQDDSWIEQLTASEG